MAVFDAHDAPVEFSDVIEARSVLLTLPALLWAAYVRLSTRVNVTFRHRVAA